MCHSRTKWETDDQKRTDRITCPALKRGEARRIQQAQHKARARGAVPCLRYEGGHLVGHQFGHPADDYNLVLMSFHLNRGAYRMIEDRWSVTLKACGSVEDVTIEINYFPNTQCPDQIYVEARVNGITESYKFDNNGGPSCWYTPDGWKSIGSPDKGFGDLARQKALRELRKGLRTK